MYRIDPYEGDHMRKRVDSYEQGSTEEKSALIAVVVITFLYAVVT
jgi:hypothetical protein